MGIAKKLIYLLLLVAAFGCKREEQLFPGIDPLLVGEWEFLAREFTSKYGVTEWRTVDSLTGKPALIVRSDGALLDGDGKEYCCITFESYSVNGEAYFPPQKKPIPYNEICNLVFCGFCGDHQFQIDGDEMIWTRCGSKLRYQRFL